MVGLQAVDFGDSDPNPNGSDALLALIYLRTAGANWSASFYRRVRTLHRKSEHRIARSAYALKSRFWCHTRCHENFRT